VHGITDEALQEAPSFYAIYPDLVRVVRGKKVIVYNASFDAGVLDHMCWLYDLPELPVRRWWCAMLWYAPYAGEWSDYHGEYRWQRLGGNHDALGDCRAVLELLQKAASNQGAIDAHRRLQESVRDLQRQWDERGEWRVSEENERAEGANNP
jgi:DNA polymerase-3 subunit epsilon